jgi:hypothetical protein
MRSLNTRGKAMTGNFRYEAPTALQTLSARILHPRTWRQKAAPWIADLKNGTRFQLASDEAALIDTLNVPIPGKSEWPASPTTLDDVARAALLRRLGYVFEWEKIARLGPRSAARAAR